MKIRYFLQGKYFIWYVILEKGYRDAWIEIGESDAATIHINVRNWVFVGRRSTPDVAWNGAGAGGGNPSIAVCFDCHLH